MSEFLKKEITKNNNYKIAYIPCDCSSEILVIRYDEEIDMIELALFQSDISFKNKASLWQKLRYIYNLFRTGQPYTDQIILKREHIERLKGFLNSI